MRVRNRFKGNKSFMRPPGTSLLFWRSSTCPVVQQSNQVLWGLSQECEIQKDVQHLRLFSFKTTPNHAKKTPMCLFIAWFVARVSPQDPGTASWVSMRTIAGIWTEGHCPSLSSLPAPLDTLRSGRLVKGLPPIILVPDKESVL